MNVLSYAELHRKGDEYHSNYIPRSNDNEDTLKAAAISNSNKKGVLKRQKKGIQNASASWKPKNPGKYRNTEV